MSQPDLLEHAAHQIADTSLIQWDRLQQIAELDATCSEAQAKCVKRLRGNGNISGTPSVSAPVVPHHDRLIRRRQRGNG